MCHFHINSLEHIIRNRNYKRSNPEPSPKWMGLRFHTLGELVNVLADGYFI